MQFFFGDDEDGFDSITIIGVSIKQLVKDIEKNPDHYDFFGRPTARGAPPGSLERTTAEGAFSSPLTARQPCARQFLPGVLRFAKGLSCRT